MRNLWLILLGLLLGMFPARAQTPVRVTVYSPLHYQVFQREGATGAVHFAGVIEPNGDYTLQMNMGAGGWLTIAEHVSRAFDAWVTLPEGQYTLSVRVDGVETAINYVGVGDIFIIAGQSNAMGYGLNLQSYTHPMLKASMFANNYQWTELRDPTDSYAGSLDTVSVDTIARGSVWPLLATHIMADQNVPVAFIPTAKAGSSVLQWLPGDDPFNRATLFGAMVNRVSFVGDVRAILWWQGEKDVQNRMSGGQYAYYLDSIANAANNFTGGVFIPALLQRTTVSPDNYLWQVNDAIRREVADNPIILPGADLTDMATYDAAHLRTDEQLAEAARRWWLALDAACYNTP